jgi:hypothetical protein
MAQKGCFCVRIGSVTPREEGFAKKMQVMLLGGWSADDMTAEAYPVSIKLKPSLRRCSWKKVPRSDVLCNYVISSRADFRPRGRKMTKVNCRHFWYRLRYLATIIN